MCARLRGSCPGPSLISTDLYNIVALTASASYANAMRCVVVINSPSGDGLQVVFNSFSTELFVDFLWLFDGTSPASPLLGVFSGTQLAGQRIVPTTCTVPFCISVLPRTLVMAWCLGQHIPLR